MNNPDSMGGGFLIYLFFVLAAVFLIWYIYVYNKYVSYKIKVDESLSGIDVALSKRFNLIGNLVETVKGYAKHEKEIFESITKLRNTSKQDLDVYHDNMTEAKHQLFALIENYPEVKADQHFLQLQHALIDTEEHLQAARRLHNHNVQKYNTFIQLSPQNLFAPIKDATKKPYFEAKTEEQVPVDISF